MTWYLILGLFILGIWGMIRKRNLIKMVAALNILNSAVIILFLYLGSLSGSGAPILVGTPRDIVDTLPQALMLTAIVVGVCVSAFSLVLVFRIHRHYGTLDIREIETKRDAADE